MLALAGSVAPEAVCPNAVQCAPVPVIQATAGADLAPEMRGGGKRPFGRGQTGLVWAVHMVPAGLWVGANSI